MGQCLNGLNRARVQMIARASGAAVALGFITTASFAQPYTWISPVSGGWGTSSNWQGGLGPPAFSDPTTALIFNAGNVPAAITATNDQGIGCQVNAITFNTFCNPSFWVSSTSSSFNFTFTAPNPSITLLGGNIGFNHLGAPTVPPAAPPPQPAIALAGNLNISGSGTGGLQIDSALTDDGGGARSVIISGGNPLRGLRLVTLTGTNSFSGGLTLDGGTVGVDGNFSNKNHLGPAGGTLTVTSNGGAIAQTMVGGTQSSLGLIQLNGDLRLIGTYNLALGDAAPATTLANAAVIQGTGTLYNNLCGNDGSTSITINSNSSGYTGAVVMDISELPHMGTAPAGSLILAAVSGQNTAPNGTLSGASSFDVRAGGALVLNNNVTDSLQNGNRVGDTTPVRLRSGTLTLDGPAIAVPDTNNPPGHNYIPTDLTEVIGPVTSAGHSTINATPSAGTSVITTLQPNSFARVERGTFMIVSAPHRGTSTVSTLGDGATANRARIILTNPLPASDFVGGGGGPGSLNVSILPYAMGEVGAGNLGATFVTYGADGFRHLQPAEYVSNNLAPGDPTSNVQLTSATSNSGASTMNSLFVSGTNTPASDGSVTGSGTLNITSGAVMAIPLNGMTSISNNLVFGNAEAVFTVGDSGVLVSGSMFGTNGLTLTAGDSGSGFSTMLKATGNNSGLTGPLTINSGFLQFASAGALPGTGTIVANGSFVSLQGKAAGLAYSGASPFTLGRPLVVDTGFLNVDLWELAAASSNPATQPTIGTMTVSGAITGAGSVSYQAQSSSVANAGQIFVTNTANTYSGVTRFGIGTFHVAGEGSLGSGGALEFAGGLSGAGIAPILVLEGDLSNSRHVNISYSGQATINTNGHNATFNGPMTGFWLGGPAPHGGFNNNAAAGFIKSGAGTLTLGNVVNTVTGQVTVSGGTLLVNGSLGASSNAVTVSTGATLGGSGAIYRGVTVGAGGTLSPSGVLTIGGGLNMAPASGSPANLVVHLNGPAAGSGYDQIVSVTQNTTAAATCQLGTAVPANLVLSLGYAPSAGAQFWLINNTNPVATANTTTGNFAGLPEGSTVALGTFGGRAYTAQISYNANFDTGQADHSGNDVVLYNVAAAPGCGSADFNCDGAIGTDADIESFFACLSGACPPPPCTSTADFNGDGSVGTDADIESFFRVLAGGNC
jgi:autotransporter-associated beta strand protein